MKRILIFLICLLTCVSAFAQGEKSYIVTNAKGTAKGVIDEAGREIIPVSYWGIEPISDMLTRELRYYTLMSENKKKAWLATPTGKIIEDKWLDGVIVRGVYGEYLAVKRKNKTEHSVVRALDGKTVLKVWDGHSLTDEGLPYYWDKEKKVLTIYDADFNIINKVKGYNSFTYIVDGFFCVRSAKTNKYGFLNNRGELVIPCEYDYAHNFQEGLACVRVSAKGKPNNLTGGKYGFIDTKGEWAIEPIFDADEGYFMDFECGRAQFMKYGDSWIPLFAIDKSGARLSGNPRYNIRAKADNGNLITYEFGEDDLITVRFEDNAGHKTTLCEGKNCFASQESGTPIVKIGKYEDDILRSFGFFNLEQGKWIIPMENPYAAIMLDESKTTVIGAYPVKPEDVIPYEDRYAVSKKGERQYKTDARLIRFLDNSGLDGNARCDIFSLNGEKLLNDVYGAILCDGNRVFSFDEGVFKMTDMNGVILWRG